MEKVLSSPEYQPGRLIDTLREKLALSSDSALASKIGIDKIIISKIRNKRRPVSAAMWLVFNQEVGLTIGTLRELAGLPPRMYIQR